MTEKNTSTNLKQLTATELVCLLRYKRHDYTASGVKGVKVVKNKIAVRP